MMVQKNWANKEPGKTVASASVSQHSFSVEEKILLMEALDHIFVSRQYQDIGLCAVCRKISIKKCSSCGTHYCSSECQAFDWPKHKAFCTRTLDNASERSSFSSKRQILTSSPVQNFNKDVFCKERLLLSDRNSPFASLANILNKESAYKFSGSKSLANFKFTNKQSKFKPSHVNSTSVVNKKPNHSCEPKKTSTPKKSTTPSSNQDSPCQNSPTDSKLSGDLNLSAGHKTVDTMIEINNEAQDERWDSTLTKPGSGEKVKNPPKPVSMNLPKIWNKKVIGMYRESADRYWVMDMNSVVKYEEIHLTLAEECEKYEYISPTIGLVCGCKYADEWYRARVLSLTPELTVHFVDYGNTSVYTYDLVKELPEKLKSVPPLVFLIQFDESTPSSFKSNDLDSLQFTIEETKRTVDGVCCVKIVSGPTGAMAKIARNKSPLSEPTNCRTVMDTLTKNSTGLLFLVPGNSETRYGSIVPEENEDAKESLKIVLNIKNPNLTPVEAKNGERVLVVDKEGNDQRGKVLSKLGETYYVQLLDCGNIITADRVYPLPDNLKDLMELGVKITVQEVLIKGMMEVVETCIFTIVGESDSGAWPCILRNVNDDVFVKAILEKPFENSVNKPAYFRPKSGSTVEITYFNPLNNIYVRVIDAETEQKFLEMNMEVLEYASRAKSFPIPPPVGEICCARFLDDGCFYRVVVNSVKSKTICVLFVDFGNQQDTDLKDVKPLPEALKIIPFFAIQVHLNGITDKSWSDSVVEYFKTLVTNNVELILTYNDSLSNGVILKEKETGVVVNKFIEQAMNDKKGKPPSVKEAFKKSEIFLDDDMEYTVVAAGTVCRLAVLYISEVEFETNYSFWATVAETENFDFVNSELSTLISEYCSTTKTPYRPSFRELCVAEFEGFWYRAMSAGNDGEFFKIFFLDFGNVCNLKASSIRKMKKELMKAPALAMNCTIVDRERLDGKPELVKKVYRALYERLNTIIDDVTIVSFHNDTFSLKIPEIEAILSG